MEENKSIFTEEELKQITTAFADANEWQQIFEELLALPDDQFEVISPTVLEAIAKSFDDPNERLVLAQALNVGGYSVEELNNTMKEILDDIDNAFPQYSDSKRMFIKSIIVLMCNAVNETEGVAKKILEIPIELGENAKMPAYATDGSGAVDLYSPAEYIIGPGETVLIPTNIKVALPKGYAFLIHPRSGLSYKSKLRVCNSIGLIDSDYRDTIGVLIENIEPKIKDFILTEDGKIEGIVYGSSYTIGAGERFAQMRLVEVPKAAFYETNSVADIGEDRGGGFGHTGKE